MHGDEPGRERREGQGQGRAPRREYRHEFRPGRMIAGLVLLGIAAVYLGDAHDLWVTPPGAAVPALLAGLVVAGVATRISYGVRRRRASRASAESKDVPPSTNGSQATR